MALQGKIVWKGIDIDEAYIAMQSANCAVNYVSSQVLKTEATYNEDGSLKSEAVYEEKNISLGNDGRKMFQALMDGLFPTHQYGQQTTIGTIEHLKNPSLTEIRKYFNKYYVPNLSLIHI